MEDENRAIEEELQWFTTKRNEAVERSNWEKVESLLTQYIAMEARVKEETRIINEVEKKLASTSFRGTKLKNKIEMSNTVNNKGGGGGVSSLSFLSGTPHQEQSSPTYLPANNGSTEMTKLEQLPPEQFDWKEYMTKRKLETV